MGGVKRILFCLLRLFKIKYYQTINNNMHSTGNSCIDWTFNPTIGYVLRDTVISASSRGCQMALAFSCSLVMAAVRIPV